MDLIDSARLGYDSQAILKEVFMPDTPDDLKKEWVRDDRITVPPRSNAWRDRTKAHYDRAKINHSCDWCVAWIRFEHSSPTAWINSIESVSSSLEQDTTSESMKK